MMSPKTTQWISLLLLLGTLLFTAAVWVLLPDQVFSGWELWRGLLYLMVGALLWVSMTWKRDEALKVVSWLTLLAVLAGSLSLLRNTPAAPLYGVETGYSLDFHTNYSSAMELYRGSGEVYWIEEKLDLVNPSVSFPFPTYYSYYAASLYGRLNETASALVYTLAQLIAYLLALWASIELAGGWRILRSGAERRIRLFLLLAIPALVSVNLGQTSLFASTGCLVGFALIFRKQGWGWFALGMILWALGVMLKPNFVLTWALFFGLAWRKLTVAGWGRDLFKARSFIAAILAPMAILLMAGLSVAVPGGVTLDTYRQFLQEIYPTLGQRLFWLWNASPMQGLARLTGGVVSSSILSVLVILLYMGYGMWRRSGPAYWLLLTLVASPVVWMHYMGIVTPILLAQYDNARNTNASVTTGLLLLVPGLFNMVYFPLSTLAILLLAFISLNRGELPGIQES